MKVAVIGSGPSGWAAQKKLLSLGHSVTIIDTDLTENTSSKSFIPTTVIPSTNISNSNLSKKLFMGSDLPYRIFPYGPALKSYGVNPARSFARGGLSLVWGATMLPYCKNDTLAWPFSISVLHDYYLELSTQIPISGISDALSYHYGDYFSRRNIFPSQRILALLEKASSHNIKKFSIGLSRLAVETGTLHNSGCFYCNKCINGCSEGYIWNSAIPPANNISNKIIMRVLKIKEVNNLVYLEGVNAKGEKNTACFDKVYMATGAIESFRILANSKYVKPEVELLDSATFFFPLLISRKLGNPKASSIALSQSFIRIDKDTKSKSSQYQLYEYSDDLILRARKTLLFGRFIPNKILVFILRKFIIAIGYLDSSESPRIKMSLELDGSVNLSLSSFGHNITERNSVVRNSVQELRNFLSPFGFRPLTKFIRYAEPGEGNHFGAWLPMGDKSDLLGRPNGCNNIHVVDSSVLPSIAPGPITFTVMANAVRIAKESTQ